MAATAEAAGWTIAGLFDVDPGRAGDTVDGHPILGPMEVGAELDAALVIAIGDNPTRRDLSMDLSGRVRWATVVHPDVVVHRSVSIGEGSVVFAGAVLQPGTTIGRHAIVNTGSVIDHDCSIGDFAHVAPGTRLAGNVHIGEGAFMGIGSVAVPGTSVGDWAIVGAGAAVIEDLPERITAVGVPARAR